MATLLHTSAKSADTVVDSRSPSHHSHSAKALAAMLLAAIVSALVVAADALIDSYADGHLLLAWSALWAIAFASMALLADTARAGAHSLLAGASQWRERRAQQVANDAMMAAAQRDPRVMAELEAAMERANCQRQHVQLAHGRAWLAHRPVGTLNAAYTGPRRPFNTSPLTGLPMHLQFLPR